MAPIEWCFLFESLCFCTKICWHKSIEKIVPLYRCTEFCQQWLWRNYNMPNTCKSKTANSNVTKLQTVTYSSTGDKTFCCCKAVKNKFKFLKNMTWCEFITADGQQVGSFYKWCHASYLQFILLHNTKIQTVKLYCLCCPVANVVYAM